MNDRDERFDRDLAGVLREIAGEEAPMSLRYRLSDITERAPISHRTWFTTPMRLSVVVAGLAVLALALLLWPRADVGPGPSESPSPSPSQSQSLEPSASAEPTPTLVPSAEQPTTAPTPAPTPIPTTEPSADWTGLAWSDPVTPSFTVHLYDVVPWGDGYVAVGELPTGTGGSDGAFFTSSDGLDWTMVQRVTPGSGRIPHHLVALGDELFAFAQMEMDRLPLGAQYGHVIWSSRSGAEWSDVDSASWREAWTGLWLGSMPSGWDATQHDIQSGLVDVASSATGIVAIGNAFREGGMEPVIIHSDDGRSWARVTLPTGFEDAMLNSVVVHHGRFVVTGAVGVGPDPYTATASAWYSDDGVSWVRATVDPGAFRPAGGFEFGPLQAGSDGLLTCSGNREMGAGGWRFMDGWASTDGATWQYAPWEYAAGFGPHAGCDWSASDGTRIVSLGPRAHASPTPWTGITVGWASPDGLPSHARSLKLSSTLTDQPEQFWVVPGGVIYAGEQSFWFGTPTFGP